MSDRYAGMSGDLSSPFEGGFVVTASDSTVFSQPTRAIWVGGAGDLAVTFLDGTTGVLKGVPVGTLLHLRATQVLSTNTTATNIFGLY